LVIHKLMGFDKNSAAVAPRQRVISPPGGWVPEMGASRAKSACFLTELRRIESGQNLKNENNVSHVRAIFALPCAKDLTRNFQRQLVSFRGLAPRSATEFQTDPRPRRRRALEFRTSDVRHPRVGPAPRGKITAR